MKKTMLIAFGVLLVSSNSYSYDRVSEVLPNGKLLVCAGALEKRTGNTVEVFQMLNEKRYDLKKVKEFSLPEVGATVELIHDEIHIAEKRANVKHTVALGTAKIISADLKGEMRRSLDEKKSSRFVTKEITAKEALDINSNCLVLETELNQVPVGTKVIFK